MTANQSTALALGTGPDAQLPDLSKPANLVKFAALFSGDQLAKLPAEQLAVFLTTLGTHLGVRAELGEIMLYQGKPYITIDGRIRIAHRSGLLNGVDAHPAASMERTRYVVKDGEHLWKCLVFKKGATRPFVGWGHVRLNDKNPVTKTHPQEMAKKRAKYDALRLAFPPKEEITGLHEQYIQEAEDEARTQGVSQLAADYDDAPDDEIVLTEEIAADATTVTAGADETPALESDADPTAMTLEAARATKLIGSPGSWSGRAGELLDTFSNKHLESIKSWCALRIEESGPDEAKQLMVDAITIILADRSKDQTNLEFSGAKTADKVAATQAGQKKDGRQGLPF